VPKEEATEPFSDVRADQRLAYLEEQRCDRRADPNVRPRNVRVGKHLVGHCEEQRRDDG
jgi:hypothetical protein